MDEEAANVTESSQQSADDEGGAEKKKEDESAAKKKAEEDDADFEAFKKKKWTLQDLPDFSFSFGDLGGSPTAGNMGFSV